VKLLLPFFCYTPTLAYNTHINNLGGVNSWEEEHFTHIEPYLIPLCWHGVPIGLIHSLKSLLMIIFFLGYITHCEKLHELEKFFIVGNVKSYILNFLAIKA
jgi:hypothetical protein